MKWDCEGDLPRRWFIFEWRAIRNGPINKWDRCFSFMPGLNFRLFGTRLYFHIHIGGSGKPKYRIRCFQISFWRTKRGVVFETNKPGIIKTWIEFNLLPNFLKYSV